MTFLSALLPGLHPRKVLGAGHWFGLLPGIRNLLSRGQGGEDPPSKAEGMSHAQRRIKRLTISDPRSPVYNPREDRYKQTVRCPYLFRSGSGNVCSLARGTAESCSAKAGRSQRGLGDAGGVGGAGLPERWARGPEGLLALRQALILQHLLRAQRMPSYSARSTLAGQRPRGPVELSPPGF